LQSHSPKPPPDHDFTMSILTMQLKHILGEVDPEILYSHH
jgi:hypothetical protein